ncbi:uncharacterized protein LOC105697593 [Orussus abietinus]|uniref:uncharacterized protein LOC105697593 n=1 Tax=Orussus abietinus TaxID=222816 RepID=UPI00062577E5|nr:uncharacterized protein LOC105697593 [Orussus abietinus]
MEIMEDGNLVDRVRILLQRDMQYYENMQTVLREPLCIRVSGGKHDFPRHASFGAIKIVMWWEAEFTAAFKRASGLSSTSIELSTSTGGVVKNLQPSDFVSMIVDTSQQFLEHLHTLIQEALDHADLTVLTATLGAAALIRNSLLCYNQQIKESISQDLSEQMSKSHKRFHEMAEAVAERLLDLHCRLISLYILNEADSLSWHYEKPFFEKERCSFVIQMWWLYMQGTKADLWNTVSPKMAQRVFTGMLNESLTILTCRFIHGKPSLARSQQFWGDAFNVLCCTAYLALSACTDGSDLAGMCVKKLPIALRDVHAKCNELLIYLLLRGTPLKILYQVFRKGLGNLAMSQPRSGPALWLLFCAPQLLKCATSELKFDSPVLPEEQAVILELHVLKSQPQPNWSQLMKVFRMNNYAVMKILVSALVRQCVGYTTKENSGQCSDSKDESAGCGGFLCPGNACYQISDISPALGLYSLVHICVCTTVDPSVIIIPALEQDESWYTYLDRQQVWSQSRPPWLNALLTPLRPMMTPIVETLLEAAKTGASLYQAMSLALACITELYLCAPIGALRLAFALDGNIPAHCHPLGGSVVLQVLCSSLYTALLEVSESIKSDDQSSLPSSAELPVEMSPFNPHDKASSATTLAEALCSIDEDNKHTDQIDTLVGLIAESLEFDDSKLRNTELENLPCVAETYADELLFTDTGRRSLKVAHEYLLRTSNWVLHYLGYHGGKYPTICSMPMKAITSKSLLHVMFHIEDIAFDQFLTGYAEGNWKTLLMKPLSISSDRVRSQVLARPEFKNLSELPLDEREIANTIKQIFSGKANRLKQ